MAVGAIPDRKGWSRRGVHGLRGLLPGRKVAARSTASRGRDLQIVIVIDVARAAGNVGMAIGQQKTGRAVVEVDVGPRGGVVAVSAVCCGER